MNLFFRILLAVYAFFLTILSFFTMMVTFKEGLFDSVTDFLKENVFASTNSRFIMLVTAFIFFALSLTFLLSGFKTDKDKKGVSKHTNIGEIKISLDTLESIALAASRKLNGVKDTKASVIKQEDSISVIIKAIVLQDINIPMLSEDMQVKIKKAIEDSAGIKVNDVRVVIENIYTGYKSRVE